MVRTGVGFKNNTVFSTISRDDVEDDVTRKVRVVKDGEIKEVKAMCEHCKSTFGYVIYGSIHVYFYCKNCGRWSDLGIRV